MPRKKKFVSKLRSTRDWVGKERRTIRSLAKKQSSLSYINGHLMVIQKTLGLTTKRLLHGKDSLTQI